MSTETEESIRGDWLEISGMRHMTIVEILRAGKARILERGWCQGDEDALYAPKPRKCCAATAMACDFGAAMFFKKVNGIESGIGDWNDAPERTLEDVLAAYDRAIAAAEAVAS